MIIRPAKVYQIYYSQNIYFMSQGYNGHLTSKIYQIYLSQISIKYLKEKMVIYMQIELFHIHCTNDT